MRIQGFRLGQTRVVTPPPFVSNGLQLYYDPATYNKSSTASLKTSSKLYWGQQQVGQVWWDISTVRFIDPNQDDIVYASRRWGQVFPGSRVDVYQWIESYI